MKKTIRGLPILVALALPWLTGCASTPKTVVVSEPPPTTAPDMVVAPPGPTYVWVPGHWSWHGRWVWVGGHWVVPPSRSAVWVSGHWVHRGNGYVWVGGYWR